MIDKKGRAETFQALVDSYEETYSWLGKQVGSEILLALASWNMQVQLQPEYRVRRHILLYWEGGWLKTSLLGTIPKLVGSDMVKNIGTITAPKLHGTFDRGCFVPSPFMTHPFLVAREFGTVTERGGDGREIRQHLLALLEEGLDPVDRVKFMGMTRELQEELEKHYEGYLKFDADGGFTIMTDSILFAATYDPKIVGEPLLADRFVVIGPEKPLDTELTKRVQGKRFVPPDWATRRLRKYISESPEHIDIASPLPDSIYGLKKLSPREQGGIQTFRLALEWWGLEWDDVTLLKWAKRARKIKNALWETKESQLMDLLLQKECGANELAVEMGVTRQYVLQLMGKLPNKPTIVRRGHEVFYRMDSI